jgi:putative phosphoesterase
MRLGIISDTHGMLRPEVFEVFKEVDHILHAGDIGSLDIITELEALAPVTAVYGNTDGMAIRAKYPRVAELRLDGFDIVVTHGDQFGREVSNEEFNRAYPSADILIHGHTHVPKLEIVDITVTVMNPGAAGARRFDIPASVGIMELEAGIPPRARLVPVSELDED